MKGDNDMARRFGIELEHANTQTHEHVAQVLEAAGINVDHSATGTYASRRYDGWQVKHDGSIRTTRTHRHAVELVSPPLPFDNSGKEDVKKALETIRPLGKVNRSCGFHVHVEARDLNENQLRRLEQFFYSWKKVLLSYVAQSRRNNNYCRPDVSRHNRYVALNLVPFALKGTVEFRLHQGTLNTQKVLAFVALCVNIVEFAKSDKDIPTEIAPNLRGDETLVKIYNGQTFTVAKREDGWEWNGTIYPTLSGAATAIGKLFGRERVSGPSFFGNPVNGNAMDLLCREIAVSAAEASFLSRSYERAVNQWGYYDN
jgi:hypothetical protein